MRPPIIVNERISDEALVLGDTRAYLTVQAAESYYEPWFVDEFYDAFDADGQYLVMSTDGRRIILNDTGRHLAPDQFRAWIAKVLEWVRQTPMSELERSNIVAGRRDIVAVLTELEEWTRPKFSLF